MNFVDKDGTTKVYIPVHPWAEQQGVGLNGGLSRISTGDSLVLNFGKEVEYTL